MTTVVLGWDGLDYKLLEEFEMADAFGPHHACLETFDNPTLGTPHTRELWPTIITGVRPDIHGIWAATEQGGLDWSNPVLDGLSTLANGVIPEGLREQIGLWLRDAGANVDQHGPEYYSERGLETVFDGRAALPLAIPNYIHPLNDQLDLVTDRGADLADFMHLVKEDGKSIHRPKVPLHVYQARLAAETGEKLGIVRTALELDYDIVFVWLGYIDSVGHISPVSDQSTGWQARAYRHAAEWTGAIREAMTPGDALVCISDHGLRGGEHTHEAVIGSTERSIVSESESVLDVCAAIDAVTPATGEGPETVRPAFIPEQKGPSGSLDGQGVRDHLEDLGYL